MSKQTEALKLALDWIEGNGKYDAAKRIAQTIREALAEESSGTEKPINIPMGDMNMGLKWDEVPQAFNDWWNAEYDPTGNPFKEDSKAYWAWAGWKAATKQPAPVAWLPPAQRKQLEGGQIRALWEQEAKPERSTAHFFTAFARAIEAAHGIKGDA